jgi:hypothetical protein
LSLFPATSLSLFHVSFCCFSSPCLFSVLTLLVVRAINWKLCVWTVPTLPGSAHKHVILTSAIERFAICQSGGAIEFRSSRGKEVVYLKKSAAAVWCTLQVAGSNQSLSLSQNKVQRPFVLSYHVGSKNRMNKGWREHFHMDL